MLVSLSSANPSVSGEPVKRGVGVREMGKNKQILKLCYIRKASEIILNYITSWLSAFGKISLVFYRCSRLIFGGYII